MKKLIVIMAILILTLTACGKQAPGQAETSEPIEPVYSSEQTGRITVGIQIGEEGYYSTCADAEISYLDGEIVDIVIYNPTLLAFRASEDWPGGYYVHSVEEIEQIREQLEDLRGIVPEEKLNEIIDALQHGLLMTEAST